MSIKSWIRDWLLNENATLSTKMSRAEVESSPEHGVQISITSAINGKVLTLRSYQPNRRNNTPQVQSDWLSEYYVLKDGESLTEALTMLLIAKGLAE